MALLNNMPERAVELIRGEEFCGTNNLVQLESSISRPSYRELATNYVFLLPVVKMFPDRASCLNLNQLAPVVPMGSSM